MNVEWVVRACPLCQSRDESHVFAEARIDLARLDAFAFASRKRPEYMHPRLIECRHCGVLYGNPVLSPETLADAYRSAAFDSSDEGRWASRTYAGQVRKLLRRLPDLDGALDIGTGDGAFLEELLRLGFRNVVGVEPSAAPIENAKSHIQPLIRRDTFRSETFPRRSFSLVSCFQTLEHVWDPIQTARGAGELLKPGGVFVIVLHNRDAFSARVLGLKSPIFDIEHLQLFSPRSARQLLERVGFSSIGVHRLWNRYPLRYWMKLLPLPEALKDRVLVALNASPIGGMPVPLPAGNLVAFGFMNG